MTNKVAQICYGCLKPMIKKHGDITLTKAGYGSYEVKGVLHLMCEECGGRIIPEDEARRVEKEGIKLHIMEVLSNKGSMPALTLKEAVRSDVELLEESAKELVSSKDIKVDYKDPNNPIIQILNKKDKKTFWQRFKDWFSRNKHNFY